MPPQIRRVQRHDGADDGIAIAQAAGVVGGHRLVHQRIHQASVDLDRLLRILTQRALGILRAVGGIVVERLLECLGLVDIGLDRISVGIDRTVEDHRPHLVRVGLGVGGADPGPVGEAEIIQLVVSDRGTKRIEILGDAGGPDIREEVGAHLVDTALNELLGLSLDMGDTLGAVVDLRICAQPIVVGVGVAPQRRCRRAHAAGVEPDQIETLAHAGRHGLDQAGGRLDTGLPRTARVDQQRPDLVADGRKSDHRQRGGRAVGIGVVDRNGDLAALGTRRHRHRFPTAAGRPARPPDHRLSDLGFGQHSPATHYGAAPGTGQQRRDCGKHHGGAHGTRPPGRNGVPPGQNGVQPHGQHAAMTDGCTW